ncbi:MAG: hypothetical protein KDE34_05670 [Anaerolineales bacterium]|nr:hypothetical protein [Anaerolineales bacterium]
MPTIGFLHTSPVHVPTFTALLAELAPEWQAIHQVDEPLLAEARQNGPDAPDILMQLQSHLTQLKEAGASQIVCTCSTIGGIAEKQGEALDLPIHRVDRPMAAQAVALGPILLVAALESTLAPTSALLADEAARQNRALQVDTLACTEAWAFFEAGDPAGYHHAIANAIRTQLDHSATVPAAILLAQASMAGAANLLADLGIPVLSSPRSCVLAVTSP